MTTVLWPLYRTTCVSRHPQLRTGGFCWSRVLLPTRPCWWQLAHLDSREYARVLLNGITYIISIAWINASNYTINFLNILENKKETTTTTTVLRPFVWDYTGELVPEGTLTHPPSWSSSNHYQLLPSTTIHSILPVQITCLAIFVHNLSAIRGSQQLLKLAGWNL